MNRVLAVLVLFFVVSCGGSRQQPGARRASSNVLTQQEIAATPVTNAYEALERLRPRFLRPQSTATRTQEYAVVYVDGVRRGALSVLRSIAANTIVEIRFVSAADATTRYGMDVSGGVIDVSLMR